jgi:hypothetical protein
MMHSAAHSAFSDLDAMGDGVCAALDCAHDASRSVKRMRDSVRRAFDELTLQVRGTGDQIGTTSGNGAQHRYVADARRQSVRAGIYEVFGRMYAAGDCALSSVHASLNGVDGPGPRESKPGTRYAQQQFRYEHSRADANDHRGTAGGRVDLVRRRVDHCQLWQSPQLNVRRRSRTRHEQRIERRGDRQWLFHERYAMTTAEGMTTIRKLILFVLLRVVFATSGYAQVPQKFTVQGVLRNGAGALESGMVNVTASFLDAASKGNLIAGPYGPKSVMSSDGLFTLTISDPALLSKLQGNTDGCAASSANSFRLARETARACRRSA